MSARLQDVSWCECGNGAVSARVRLGICRYISKCWGFLAFVLKRISPCACASVSGAREKRVLSLISHWSVVCVCVFSVLCGVGEQFSLERELWEFAPAVLLLPGARLVLRVVRSNMATWH